MKEISIIIPVHNAGRFIGETLDSIRGQEYRDYEVILVDDGSTDNSLALLSKFQEEGGDVAIIKSEHIGTSAARNLGLREARGIWMMFLQAGDIMDESFLSECMHAKDYCEDVDIDLIAGNADLVAEDGSLLQEAKIRYANRIYHKSSLDILMDLDPCSGTKLYRRDIIEKNGIRFADVSVGQDLDFYLKYLYFCDGIYLNNNAKIRHRTEGCTAWQEALDIINVYKDAEEFLLLGDGTDYQFIQALENSKAKQYSIWFSGYPYIADKQKRAEVFETLGEAICNLDDRMLGRAAKEHKKKAEKKLQAKWMFLSEPYVRFRRWRREPER